MDFLPRLKNYIVNHVNLNAPIEAGLLSKNSKSVAVRETPGQVPDRYMDKGKIYQYNFQVLVKDPNYMTASNVCNSIFQTIDGLPPNSIMSEDGSFLFITCRTYVTPNFVNEDEHHSYIFSAIFEAQLQQGGN